MIFTGKHYDVGTIVHIEHTFVDPKWPHDPQDPTSSSLVLTNPAHSQVTVPITRVSKGKYSFDISVQIAGQWFIDWNSADPIYRVRSSFVVRRAKYVPPVPVPMFLDWSRFTNITYNQLQPVDWNGNG